MVAKQECKKKRILFSRSSWRRLLKLSWKVKLLLLGSFMLSGIVRLAILIVPFRYITPFMGKKMLESTEVISLKQRGQAVKIAWCVNTMSRFTPWESKCLVRAFTAQIILRVFRIPSTLYLGVAKDGSNQLMAHAWLRCGQLILTGGDERDGFKEVARFATFTEYGRME